MSREDIPRSWDSKEQKHRLAQRQSHRGNMNNAGWLEMGLCDAQVGVHGLGNQTPRFAGKVPDYACCGLMTTCYFWYPFSLSDVAQFGPYVICSLCL